MTIGLILLGIVAVLIFFGITERFFRRIGISNGLAFVLVLALVIGAIVPEIRFGSAFSVNISGFLIPVVLVVLFSAIIGFNSDLSRAYLASVAVAGVAVAVRMLIMPTNFASVITASVIVGLVGGAVAYLIGMTRISTIIAAVAGIVMGDIVVNILNRFVLSGAPFALGSSGVFDSIIIAAVFGVLLVEAITAVKRTMNRKQVSKTALNMEAGEDNDMTGREVSTLKIEEDNDTETDFNDYFDDV